MSDVKKTLYKSLNLGIEGSEVVPQEVEILDEDNSASAEAIESIGDHAEVKELQADSDELEAINEDGAELIAAVEMAVASKKGLTPIEGAALRLAMKQITGKYSAACLQNLPAREAYGGTADAYESTVLALEDMKSTFSTFFAAAKAQFLKLVEGFQKLFRNVVQRFGSVSKRAQAVKARAADLTADPDGQVKVNYTSLSVNDNPSQLPEDVTKGMQDIVRVASALLAATRSLDGRAQVTKGLSVINDDAGWKDFVETANMETGKVFSSLSERDASGSGNKFTEYLPGQTFIVLKQPGGSDTVDEFAVEKILNNHPNNGEKDGTAMVAALTKDQIDSVATSVISISDAIGEYQKVWGRTSSRAAHLVAGIEKAAASIEKELDSQMGGEIQDKVANLKTRAAAFIRFVKNVEELPASFVLYAQETCNAALTYAELSLNAVGQQPEQ